jgi:hypothetical protein
MKKTLFTLAMLTLLWGCKEHTATDRVPPRLKIRIVCPQTTIRFGEPVTIMIMMQKLVNDMIEAPIAYWSAIVRVDGKEFTRPWGPDGGPDSIMDKSWPQPPWSGPAIVPKDSEIGIGLTLSEYGISKDVLSVGTHEVVVTIGQDVSNTLIITVIKDR